MGLTFMLILWHNELGFRFEQVLTDKPALNFLFMAKTNILSFLKWTFNLAFQGHFAERKSFLIFPTSQALEVIWKICTTRE